jgi:4-hydroxybenzoyl-CoA reductase subunit beta
MLALPPFAHHSPRTLDEAIGLLRDLGPDVSIVAGGTDLIPNMKRGLLAPRHLVSLAGIASLRGVRQEDETIRIGAMTSLESVALSPLVQERASGLAESASAVGGPQHRRMGTLGGNLCLDTRCRYYNQTFFWRSALGFCLKKDGTKCHVVSGGQKCVAAASNDTAAALLALEAEVELVGPNGVRRLLATDFYTADGISNTVRARDEIVIAVRVPLRLARSSAYEKLRRRAAIDFPLLSVAARCDADGDRIRDLEIVVSALAARPRVIKATRALAVGKALSDAPRSEIAEAVFKECTPLPNVDEDTVWRKRMVRVLVDRALVRLGVGGPSRDASR